jgi:hypothetical protein
MRYTRKAPCAIVVGNDCYCEKLSFAPFLLNLESRLSGAKGVDSKIESQTGMIPRF